MFKRTYILVLGTLLFASAGHAQSNDVSATFGGMFSPSVKGPAFCEACPVVPSGLVDRSISPGFAFDIALSHRLVTVHAASLHLELPFTVATGRNASTGIHNQDFSSFFIAPSLKLKLLPASGISPFVSVGGGLAHFSESSVTDNKGAFQVGGGLDFKTRLPLLGFRVEARDFITGRPGTPSFTGVTNDQLHNIFVGGGITLHF
jgi:hypothetical protein